MSLIFKRSSSSSASVLAHHILPHHAEKIPPFSEVKLRRFPAATRIVRTMSRPSAPSALPGPGGTTSAVQTGGILHVTLDRPRALNALSLEMVRSLAGILGGAGRAGAFGTAPDAVRCLLVSGAGGKAFCAGGDVRSVYESGKGGSGVHGRGTVGLGTADFFREEYAVVHALSLLPRDVCPQVSVWDGIVFGGGVGISVHGQYRVATENTLFAMPETGIGFFPDVGGTYFLSRLGGIGTYLALTGARLTGPDVFYAGLATHYVPSHRVDSFRRRLLHLPFTEDTAAGGGAVAEVLDRYHDPSAGSASRLAADREEIDVCFSETHQTVEEILDALGVRASEGSAFAQKTLVALRTKSPTSLRVTLEGLRRGAALDTLAECLRMEYRLSQAFMRQDSDFYEGVRSVLVDKDHSPRWNPGSLEDTSDEYVLSHFENLGEQELELLGWDWSSKL